MCLSPRFIKHNAFKMPGPRRLVQPPSPRSPSVLAPTASFHRGPGLPGRVYADCVQKSPAALSPVCVSPARAEVLLSTPRISVSWCKAAFTMSSPVNPGASTRPGAPRISVMDAVSQSAAPTAEPSCSGAPHSEEGQPLSI